MFLQRINICEKNEKTSQYKGVCWNKQTGKWFAALGLKGDKPKFGGLFKDELDAAKKVNQLCEEFGFAQQNPTVSAIPDEQYQVTKNCFFLWHGIV